jgi:hypothetical protein
MSIQEEMKKVDRSLPGRDTTVRIRDGELSILIKLRQSRLKEHQKTLDGIEIDHSTWSQDYQ